MSRSIDASSSGVFPSASGYPRPRSPTYDTLAQVMKKVNSELQALELSNRVDESLVKLRDALAHGRVLADVPEGPFRIFKFSKPGV